MPSNEFRLGTQYSCQLKDGAVSEILKIPAGERWTIKGVYVAHVTGTITDVHIGLSNDGSKSVPLVYVPAAAASGIYNNQIVSAVVAGGGAGTFLATPAALPVEVQGEAYIYAAGDASTGIAIFVEIDVLWTTAPGPGMPGPTSGYATPPSDGRRVRR